jgi:hypothetical protein
MQRREVGLHAYPTPYHFQHNGQSFFKKNKHASWSELKREVDFRFFSNFVLNCEVFGLSRQMEDLL